MPQDRHSRPISDMHRPGGRGPMPIRQRRLETAARLIAYGASDAEAAEVVGVKPGTLQGWRGKDRQFNALIMDYREQRAEELVPALIAGVEARMRAGDPRIIAEWIAVMGPALERVVDRLSGFPGDQPPTSEEVVAAPESAAE